MLALAVVLSCVRPPGLTARSSQTADRERFDVASIKPGAPGGIPNTIRFLPGGLFTATNTTVRELIRLAYDLQPSQLVGEPPWIGSTRVDVAARAGVERRPSLAMLRNLLAERFQLTTHRETRELAFYALVVARADRRLAPRLRPSSVDCSTPPVNAADGRQYCDAFVPAPPKWLAGGVTLSQIVLGLSQQVRATVVDRTDLTGRFDVELEWTPEGLPRPAGAPADQPVRLNGSIVDPNGPSIFAAVQDQLGLRLEERKGPVEVVVIDSVSPPSPD